MRSITLSATRCLVGVTSQGRAVGYFWVFSFDSAFNLFHSNSPYLMCRLYKRAVRPRCPAGFEVIILVDDTPSTPWTVQWIISLGRRRLVIALNLFDWLRVCLQIAEEKPHKHICHKHPCTVRLGRRRACRSTDRSDSKYIILLCAPALCGVDCNRRACCN